ncbi:MAG: cobalamin B12-binding domain-containing protein, partial [Candidatus Woesearchaeota archaeon]|nr:cobalamin B12-binding domain-containing protein [Candidatus Woesearchaeota archaeon]
MSEAESKKLLLINPPWRLKEIYGKRVVAHGVFPPHGLISLAGYLREKGIELDLVDADPLGYSVEDIKRIIEEKKPDVVGLTVTTSTFKIAYDIAKAAKECNAIVVMGG